MRGRRQQGAAKFQAYAWRVCEQHGVIGPCVLGFPRAWFLREHPPLPRPVLAEASGPASCACHNAALVLDRLIPTRAHTKTKCRSSRVSYLNMAHRPVVTPAGALWLTGPTPWVFMWRRLWKGRRTVGTLSKRCVWA